MAEKDGKDNKKQVNIPQKFQPMPLFGVSARGLPAGSKYVHSANFQTSASAGAKFQSSSIKPIECQQSDKDALVKLSEALNSGTGAQMENFNADEFLRPAPK